MFLLLYVLRVKPSSIVRPRSLLFVALAAIRPLQERCECSVKQLVLLSKKFFEVFEVGVDFALSRLWLFKVKQYFSDVCKPAIERIKRDVLVPWPRPSIESEAIGEVFECVYCSKAVGALSIAQCKINLDDVTRQRNQLTVSHSL